MGTLLRWTTNSAVNPMLQDDERVQLAFKAGRDLSVLTSKRVLLIDVQGLSGAKVEYKSIPYSCVRAFAVQSAGSWDTDAEMYLYLRTPWLTYVKQDLRKGKADILAIQKLLCHYMLSS